MNSKMPFFMISGLTSNRATIFWPLTRSTICPTTPHPIQPTQALEMTNGETLADLLKRGAKSISAASTVRDDKLIAGLYLKALGRTPTSAETQLARQMTRQPEQETGIEDMLWAVAMLPEFQLI